MGKRGGFRMIKLVCYGVRETEVPYFHKLNEEFGYDLTLVEKKLKP